MTEKTYNFGEKSSESYKTKDGWKDLPVIHHAKYKASRAKAIDLIESKTYGLEEADFWILKNASGFGDKMKLYYTGLIISHNGCLKINDKLDDKLKFDPDSVSFLKDEGSEKVMQYINKEQKVFEFGEISPNNCKNDYLYAMVLKRLMDRVILKNSKVGFFGIYSEAESDDFKESPESEEVNAFGLKKNGGLANGSDMKETLDKKNEEDFKALKQIIENCGGEEELKEVWTSKENAKILSSLKKWRPELYKMLEDSKDLMKESFKE